MIYKIHKAAQRGVAEHGWLHSRFSFSFAEYRDFERMGFGVLRVLNDDVIEPNQGFDMHPHNDMEIITVVTKGSLEHRDSEKNHGVIHEGEIQYMSAGSGVYHSEFNPSKSEDVELFQIWIHPNVKGAKPLYDQRNFNTKEQQPNEWLTLVSGDGRSKSMMIRQDALISTTKLDKSRSINIPLPKDDNGRLLIVIDGSIEIDTQVLSKRDEIQITDKEKYTIKALEDSHLMLFEVPMHR